MGSGYYLADGVTDLDAVFEPASGGNGIASAYYVRLDNGAALEYAGLSYGTAAATTEYYTLADLDFNGVWAKKGSVNYLEPSTSFLSSVNLTPNTQTKAPLQAGGTRWNNAHVNGANDTAHGVYSTNSLMWDPTTIGTANCGYGNTGAADVPDGGAYMEVIAHGAGDTLTATLSVSINNDGTWSILAYGTNGDMDKPTDGSFTNPNPAVALTSGQWAGVTGSGIGAGYTYSASFSNQKNFSYYAVGPGGSAGNTSSYSWSPTSTNSQYQYVNPGWNNGYNTGPPSTSTTGALSGSLSSNAVLSFNVTCTAALARAYGNGGSDYEVYGEDNWYHRLFSIDFSFTITSADGHTLIGQIPLCIGMHWNWTTYGSSPPSGGGGGGGGGGCVATSMYLQPELLAGEAYRGLLIDGVAYHPDSVTPRMIDDIAFMLQPCLRMETVSGIELIASTTTPMTMPDGSCKMFPDMLGELVLVDDNGDIHWEEVTALDNAGMLLVALISMKDQNYFAGTDPRRRIGSHNLIAPK
jgi:hypothetical protein